MSRSGDTALAFLLGAVTGGVIALLLAPEKGSVTRRKLRDGATDMYGKGKTKARELGDEVTHRAEGATDWVKEKAGEVADTARHQVDAVKSAMNEGKEAYKRELGKS